MNNTDPQREICVNKLIEMQKDPAIKCDIVSPADFMKTAELIEHTDAYVDYLRRVYANADIV